jgi:hypothetical protein
MRRFDSKQVSPCIFTSACQNLTTYNYSELCQRVPQIVYFFPPPPISPSLGHGEHKPHQFFAFMPRFHLWGFFDYSIFNSCNTLINIPIIAFIIYAFSLYTHLIAIAVRYHLHSHLHQSFLLTAYSGFYRHLIPETIRHPIPVLIGR